MRRHIANSIEDNFDIIAATAFCVVLLIAALGAGGLLGAAITALAVGLMGYVVIPYSIFVKGWGIVR